MEKTRSSGNSEQATVSEYDIRFAAVCNLAAGFGARARTFAARTSPQTPGTDRSPKGGSEI